MKLYKSYIKAADDFDLDRPYQEYDSANTSINSTKLPAIYRLVKFQPGDVVLDYGGGKFDNAVNYLADKDVTLLVYDPYNRTDEHNREVLHILKENGGADATVCSNVLNVIKEPQVRFSILKNIQKLTKPGGKIYITVYEGSGTGNEGPTKSGYQLNRKTADYLEEVQQVFINSKRKGKLITAINSSTRYTSKKRINSATNTCNISPVVMSADSNKFYWYFTTHGVQIGSVPKYANIYEIIDTPNGSYFATDTVITTKDLEKYEIRERSLPDSLKSKSVLASSSTKDYQMLSRLQQDCEYFLKEGNKDSRVLWAKSVPEQIDMMRELYDKLDPKPDWITLQDIENYETEMSDDLVTM